MASMREKMPTVAAYIDSLRAAWGDDFINDIIRRGVRGEPVFHAVEGGHEVGTAILAEGTAIVRFNEKTGNTTVHEMRVGERKIDVYARIEAESEATGEQAHG